MEVNFAPDLQAKLNDLAAKVGKPADELVQDAVAGYVHELAELRNTLDSRYDDLESGTVQGINGEEARALLKAKTDAERNRRV